MSPLRRYFLVTVFGVAAFGCLALAAQQLVARIPYEWDMYIWSESPFLTNMLKIDAGQPIYTSPDQANSFVYSPGLEYVTYALLKPFNRHLDIRFCRVVSVGFAVLASLALMRCSVLLGRELFPLGRSRWFPPLTAAIFFLIIYSNFTSDVPHPDNLHICHLAVTMLLTFEAIRRPSAGRAIFAILFASLGVLVKQTATLSALGVVISLVAFAPRKLRTASWALPLAAVASAAALTCLWSIGQARFYTFVVLSTHGIQKDRFPELFRDLFEGHRLLPLTLFAIAAYCGFRSRNRALKQLLLAHLLIGIFEAAPALLAFLKPMGNWNNLMVIEAWAAVPIVPFLLLSLLGGDAVESDGSRPIDGFARATCVVLAFCLVYCYLPAKYSPQQSHYDYSRKIESGVTKDMKAGKRVLLGHGTSILVRNDPRQIPLDRANSYLELFVAGKSEMTATKQRVREHYYDKIYLNSAWYSHELFLVILENYRLVDNIPAPVDWMTGTVLDRHSIKHGFQPIHCQTLVYEALESPASAKPQASPGESPEQGARAEARQAGPSTSSRPPG